MSRLWGAPLLEAQLEARVEALAEMIDLMRATRASRRFCRLLSRPLKENRGKNAQLAERSPSFERFVTIGAFVTATLCGASAARSETTITRSSHLPSPVRQTESYLPGETRIAATTGRAAYLIETVIFRGGTSIKPLTGPRNGPIKTLFAG